MKFIVIAEKLGLGTPAVISMSARAKAIHAFFLMLYNKVPAVAIVSGNGELVGNLSASDLRVIFSCIPFRH